MKIINRTFHHDYEELEKYEAGISLTGSEVKSAKLGYMKLEDAFVKIVDGSAVLLNAEIPIYNFTRPLGYEPRRTRKLLLHKKEILRLQVKLAASPSLTIAPISCYNKGRLLKLEIALAKGRKDIEKKKLVKQRDVTLEQKREAREYMKR